MTRYFVSALLGPNARVLLVKPDDGVIIASWRAGGHECLVEGEWISPYADLEAIVQGEDRTPSPAPSVLRLVDGGPPRTATRTPQTAAS